MPDNSMVSRDGSRGAADLKPTGQLGHVVLLHGLGVGGWFMRPLAWRLAQGGYSIHNWSYGSFFSPIERHGQRLADWLRKADDDPGIGRLNLVTHSMGSIVARHALSLYTPEKLGRFVMLAPPNTGSHLATLFAPWLGRCFPPITQLTERPESFVNRLPLPRGVEVGVIAATWDYLVPLANTHLDCEADHIVLRGWHGGLVFQRGPAQQTLHFLKHGQFERPQ